MARIRNTKPEFYIHEELNDLESNFPELKPMLVFSGLWNQCEFSGVFLWSARKLKLAILPFVDFDIEKSLTLLEEHGFIRRYQNDGKIYGHVVNFSKYQAISGSEKAAGLKYPLPDDKNSQMISRKSDDKTMTKPVKSEKSQTTADLGHRTKDLGLRTKDINSSGEKNSNPPLGEREPQNDMEQVEDSDTLCSQGEAKAQDPVTNGDVSFPGNSDHEKPVSPSARFIWHWQHNGDIFNPLAHLKKPNEWKEFWAKSNITVEQIDIGMKNYTEAIKSGVIDRLYIPANPDTFVLNGWIQKSQERYQKQGPPPSTGRNKPVQGKKSLGGLTRK
jgi:hypothetical protein